MWRRSRRTAGRATSSRRSSPAGRTSSSGRRHSQILSTTLIDLLRELVEIESPTGETRDLGERLAAELEALGGRVEWFGEHVRADFGGREPPLLVLGHLDTVWERETLAARPFRVAGDRAYGPG